MRVPHSRNTRGESPTGREARVGWNSRALRSHRWWRPSPPTNPAKVRGPAPSLELLLLWRCEKGKILHLGQERCRSGLSKGTRTPRVTACNAQAPAKEDVLLLPSSSWHCRFIPGMWQGLGAPGNGDCLPTQASLQLRRGHLHS